jgi:hypothetical protein
LIRCDFERLDVCMHRIGTLYAQHFNRRYDLDGALCARRFWSAPIESERQLLATGGYIERNALDVDPNRPLGEYRWSSLGAIKGTRPCPSFLDPGVLIDAFNGDRRGYVRFVEQSVDRRGRCAVPTGPGSTPTFAQDAIETAAGTAVPTQPSIEPEAGSLVVHVILMLSMEYGAMSAKEMAHRYGYANAATVRSTTSRARRRFADEPRLFSTLELARSLLHAAPRAAA